MSFGTSYQANSNKDWNLYWKKLKKVIAILFYSLMKYMLVEQAKTKMALWMLQTFLNHWWLARELHLVGLQHSMNIENILRKDAALERRMQKIDVLEPTTEGTIAILRGIKRFENFHNVKILMKLCFGCKIIIALYIW